MKVPIFGMFGLKTNIPPIVFGRFDPLNGCNINDTNKKHILVQFCIVGVIRHENPFSSETCRQLPPKEGLNKKSVIIHFFASKPSQILYWGASSRHNRLCQISSLLVKGRRFCGGVENRISHRQSQSPLTLCCLH